MGSEFKIGDVVRLKHGGPRMTITQIFSEEKVYAVWFSNDLEMLGSYFPSAALEDAPRLSR